MTASSSESLLPDPRPISEAEARIQAALKVLSNGVKRGREQYERTRSGPETCLILLHGYEDAIDILQGVKS